MRGLCVCSGVALVTLAQWGFTWVLPSDQLETTGSVPDTLVFCTTLGNAELPANNQIFLGEENPDASKCSAHIWADFDISDLCGDSVTYDVGLYLFDGPDPVTVVNQAAAVRDSNGIMRLSFDTRESDLPSDHPIATSGVPYTGVSCNSASALHRLEIGIQSACLDSTIEHIVQVLDCVVPVLECVQPYSVNYPNSGRIILLANDFIAEIRDDCTPLDELQLSFSGDEYVPSRIVDCEEEYCNGSPVFDVTIWVADAGYDLDCDGVIEWHERNKESCSTEITLLADGLWCFEFPFIYGKITTEENEFVDSVHVFLSRLGQPLHEHSAGGGSFYFYDDCPEILDSLSIHCTRDGNYRNGVSTLDLIKVQKHLLGLEYLDSPYKLIAADVNNSGNISVLDIVDMRKLILRLNNEFPDNSSWRFVPDYFSFQDPTHPWPVPEILEVERRSGLDFIGVKIGDVNGNAIASAVSVEERNNRAQFIMRTSQIVLKKGRPYRIPFYAVNMSDNEGFQFTIQTRDLEFVGIEPGVIDVGDENVGRHDGAITMSWGSIVPVTYSDQDVVFTLTFVALQDGLLSETLGFSSSITPAEAYALSEGVETILNPVLVIRDSGQTNQIRYQLYPNTPNPFSDQTVVGFTLPNTGNATLTLFDVHGRAVLRLDKEAKAGYNEVLLERSTFNAPGVWYYRLDSGGYSATRKMVLLN